MSDSKCPVCGGTLTTGGCVECNRNQMRGHNHEVCYKPEHADHLDHALDINLKAIDELVRVTKENTKLKDQLAHANVTVAAAEEHITELKRELFKERKALVEAKGRLGIVEDMCRTVTELRNSYKLDGGKL